MTNNRRSAHTIAVILGKLVPYSDTGARIQITHPLSFQRKLESRLPPFVILSEAKNLRVEER